ncbi:MAG: hypothetical protein LDLANPLL_00942 [Turneriella sp.]|nr:hypothetical protein [Turneriella sp.]
MDERVTIEYVYEYWDCLACGKKGIRGDHRFCPACGKARDANVQFYRKRDAEEIIRDENTRERLSAGADWICNFCSSANNIHDVFCPSCGAKSDASGKPVQRVGDKPKTPKKNLPRINSQGKKKKFPWSRYAVRGLIIVLATGVLWCGYKTVSCVTGYFRTQVVTYKVIDKKWKVTVYLEQKSIETFTAWKENVPRGAQIIKKVRKVRNYRDVASGTRTEKYDEKIEVATTREQQVTTTERVQSGEREECNTTYESVGSGAARKITRCRKVPVYTERNVTKKHNVPVTEEKMATKEREVTNYVQEAVYDTEVTYRAWAWNTVRSFTSEGNKLPIRQPQILLAPRERTAFYRLTSPRVLFEVAIQRQGEGDAPESTSVFTLEEEEFTQYRVGGLVDFFYTPAGQKLERKK